MLENKECSICGFDKFDNLDYMRDQLYWYDRNLRDENEPVGFKICKECGFVTYDYKSNDELKESYDQQRKIVSINNIITCNRKNEYHKSFLKEIMAQLQPAWIYPDKKEKDYRFLDVGCAQGSFLNMLHEEFFIENKNLYGTEWNQALSSFAKNEYNLNITEEIDNTIKYDFISYYHVLEHIQSPEAELKKIRELLVDNGFLYISVPVWFGTFEEASGTMCNDFENLYHLNHVNVFSKLSFQNLLTTNGFEIIKENDKMYGYTVLCRKTVSIKLIVKENYLEIKEKLEKQKSAIDLLNQKKHEEAYNLIKDYPDAYIFHSLNKDNMKDFNNQKAILEKALEHCPDHPKILVQLGRLHFQFDENNPENVGFYSNNIKKAESIFNQVLLNKPASEEVYFFLAMIEGKYKKNYEKAVDFLKKTVSINPMKYQESINMIAYFWFEKEKQNELSKMQK